MELKSQDSYVNGTLAGVPLTYESCDFSSMTLSPRADDVFKSMSDPSPALLARMAAGCNPLCRRKPSTVTSESNPMPMAANDMGVNDVESCTCVAGCVSSTILKGLVPANASGPFPCLTLLTAGRTNLLSFGSTLYRTEPSFLAPLQSYFVLT